MNRVQLQPSVFDRLDPVAGAIRWWTTQMLDLFGQPRRKVVPARFVDQCKGRLPRHVVIELDENDGFVARAKLPKGQAAAHRQAIQLRLPELAPTPDDQLFISTVAVATDEGGATSYRIAMARQNRLNQLETSARRKGAATVRFSVEGEQLPEFVSPKAHRRARSAMFLDAAIILGLVVAGTVAVNVWTKRLDAETEAIAHQESSLRRAVIAAETARQQSDLSQDLVKRGVLNRRGANVIKTLTTLNASTPDSAWWTRIRWTPTETAIVGQSLNATQAIGALSEATKDWSVELSGPLAAAPAGTTQAFEVIVKPRGAPTP